MVISFWLLAWRAWCFPRVTRDLRPACTLANERPVLSSLYDPIRKLVGRWQVYLQIVCAALRAPFRHLRPRVSPDRRTDRSSGPHNSCLVLLGTLEPRPPANAG